MDIVFITAITRDHLGNEKHTAIIDKIKERTQRQRISVRPPAGPHTSGFFPKKGAREDETPVRARPQTATQYSFQDASVLRKKEERRIRDAIGVVAEISIENMELGMQLETAIRLGKPILALLRESSISLARQTTALLVGASRVTLRWYKDESDAHLDQHLDEFLSSIKARSAAR